MADAKKCDRCGKYYDAESSKDKNFRVNGITVYQMALINAYDHPIHNYDLCDQCARDLFHWLCKEEEEEDDLTEEDTSTPWVTNT